MGIILNKEELIKGASLETAKLREDALDILEAGLEAIDTEKILRRKLKVENGVLNIENGISEVGGLDLKSFERIFFIGIGKCAFDGAKIIEEILGDFLTDGIALDVKFGELKKIKSYAGTHPYPSEINVSISKEILEMVKGVTKKDLVITLISGGGSSLFELPITGLSLEDIINRTKTLTTQGADIYELNKARKEMSQVKGGKFAEICRPATMLNLIFSDVLGNDFSVIASGPTVLAEPDDKVKNILLVSNRDALEAMKEKAEKFGYKTSIETETLSGDAKKIGKELISRKLPVQVGQISKTCILFGGETTVKINGNGVGGRNQTMALSALSYVRPNSLLVCVASDGWDNTDHAGAIVDSELFEKAKQENILPTEFLNSNDSYNFFKKVGGAIYTGRLGSNVSDLYIMLYK